ncbi:hypothetical protein H0H87_010823 [Tephrocybe sp. NHM501043]|nr:hypothetical protein H0H87_010823 [Tephrocybe sp. NHM501043]
MAHTRPTPRHTVANLTAQNQPAPDIHHRALPIVRSSLDVSLPSSHQSSPRLSPLLPSATFPFADKSSIPTTMGPKEGADGPRICGMPLKYVSLVTLAVQNAALSIVMHYSRVSTPPELSYSPAAAVLLNEILKGTISFVIALSRTREVVETPWHRLSLWGILCALPFPGSRPFWSLCGEIFSRDCWKLSIPALLYVVQNSLQFVAISNLPVASFQVTYQMKILTTAAFSVALLRKKLSSTKWLSLFFLAIGVGIVQIQTSSGDTGPKPTTVGSAHEYHHVHVMNPMKGFGAVTAACFTSGLAGVYFEMVLKNSRADLWVRNVQLSLFSLIPALLPILYAEKPIDSQGLVFDLFRNFGTWAWATVAIQVFGGLVTAIVIKYSDNILKGFATSLSIVLSFLASVFLFDFHITLSFIIGASTVLSATWMYNQPAGKEPVITLTRQSEKATFPGSPITPDEPILGQFTRKKSSTSLAIASALGINIPNQGVSGASDLGTDMLDTTRYNQAPYGSPYTSRTPSRLPSRAPTPIPSPLHSEGNTSP